VDGDYNAKNENGNNKIILNDLKKQFFITLVGTNHNIGDDEKKHREFHVLGIEK